MTSKLKNADFRHSSPGDFTHTRNNRSYASQNQANFLESREWEEMGKE